MNLLGTYLMTDIQMDEPRMSLGGWVYSLAFHFLSNWSLYSSLSAAIRQFSAKVRTPPHYKVEQQRLASMKITEF